MAAAYNGTLTLGHSRRCMKWLEENHPSLFAKYYSESALPARPPSPLSPH